MKKRIGIEAVYLLKKNKSIVELEKVELIRSIIRIDNENDFTIITKNGPDTQFLKSLENVNVVITPDYPTFLWNHFTLPKYVKNLSLDLLHCTSILTPFFTTIPVIVNYERTYQNNSFRHVLLYQLYRKIRFVVRKRLVSKAELIITPSKIAKKRLRKVYGINKQNIDFIRKNTLVTDKSATIDEFSYLKFQSTFPKAYILFHKTGNDINNLTEIIKAYIMYAQTIKNPFPLVLTKVNKSYLDEILYAIPETRNYKKLIVCKEKILTSEIDNLYRQAVLLFQPMDKNGSSTPLISALILGTPIITSNYKVFKTVAADSAFYVEPYSIEDMAVALVDVLSDVNRYSSMIEKGYLQAKKFKKEKVASETIQAYQQVLK